MALRVVDRAIQSFGAEGLSQDQALAEMWSGVRTLRIADVRVCNLRSAETDRFATGTRCREPFLAFVLGN